MEKIKKKEQIDTLEAQNHELITQLIDIRCDNARLEDRVRNITLFNRRKNIGFAFFGIAILLIGIYIGQLFLESC